MPEKRERKLFGGQKRRKPLRGRGEQKVKNSHSRESQEKFGVRREHIDVSNQAVGRGRRHYIHNYIIFFMKLGLKRST